MAHPFDRTYEGLKLHRGEASAKELDPFDRTYEGLKLVPKCKTGVLMEELLTVPMRV